MKRRKKDELIWHVQEVPIPSRSADSLSTTGPRISFSLVARNVRSRETHTYAVGTLIPWPDTLFTPSS